MTPRDKARSTVQKLLALASNPGTPAEGEAALRRAHILAAKHGFKIQKRPKQPERPSAAEWLANWARNVNRADAERSAREFKRQQTRIRNVRAAGAKAFRDGTDIVYNPYKRGATFGVNQHTEWRRGWLKAKEESQ